MANELSVGRIVGRYRVDAPLRESSRLRLYAATETDDAWPVTLGVLRGVSEHDLDAFARRAELLSSIAHPHVAPIYEVGRVHDGIFFARRRVPGLDLKTLLASYGPIRARQALEIAEQIAKALAALHREGIAAGDLSLDNIVVQDHAGEPFAQVVDLDVTSSRRHDEVTLAPEVRAGEQPGPSADVYALGAVLLGELAGGLPQPPATVLKAHADELPGAMEHVIAQALDPRPERRFGSPVELVAAARAAADPLSNRAIAFDESEPVGAEPLADEPPPPPPPPAAGGGDGDGEDPPRSSYALLAAPETVVAGQQFELTIGLSPRPDPRVAGDEQLDRPPSSHGPYRLSIHVDAPDFTLAKGQRWRNELDVTRAQAFPSCVLRLTARQPTASWASTRIQATYSVEGQTMGVAVRPIGVAGTAAALPRARADGRPRTTRVASSQAWATPHLTVNILRGSQPDTLRWLYEADPALGLELPRRAEQTRLGNDPAAFARNEIGEIPNQAPEDVYLYMRGTAKRIAKKVPPGFWRLLRAAAASLGSAPPTVLVNSFDPYVPWELALVEPPLDPGRPPFLGAQAIVGRWVPDEASDEASQLPRRPSDPASSMSVVSGRYDDPSLRRLKAAEEEALALARTYGAVRVEARKPDVLGCLREKPVPDILHFSMHARGEVGGLRNGLLMTDGEVLGPTTILGLDFGTHPFVFLNACEAGKGEELLGDYAGIAEAFIGAGAAGVVAPLWEVDDEVARDLAIRFYEDVFRDRGGAAVADRLRAERAQFGEQAETATALAYVFYGHPAMRLHGKAARRA